MEDPASRLRTFFDELVGSYINIFLLIFCVVLLVKILRKSFADSVDDMPRAPSLPPMKKRDFTLNELRQYDGKTVSEDGENRILIAVNHKVIDVTRGRHLYGPGGPYDLYAGRDVSRGLATFTVDSSVVRETYDDLSDLSPSERDALGEWEDQLVGKYEVVGRLLAPGETARNYDEENGDDGDAPETGHEKAS